LPDSLVKQLNYCTQKGLIMYNSNFYRIIACGFCLYSISWVSGMEKPKEIAKADELLHNATLNGDLNGVKHALETEGANIETADIFNPDTPLITAASGGFRKIFDYLILKGANVNARGYKGRTALMGAVKSETTYKAFPITKTLIAAGATIELADNDGNTPLLVAVAQPEPHIDLTKYLVEQGHANINIRTNAGDSVLHKAVSPKWSADSKELLDYLISKGADLAAKNNAGDTILHSAARAGRLDAIEYLLGKGIDINAKNSVNATPLHHAVLNDHLKAVEYLVDHGADIDAKDSSGHTPEQLAKPEETNGEAIKLLFTSVRALKKALSELSHSLNTLAKQVTLKK